MVRHELSPCDISGTLHHAVEKGTEVLKLTLLGLSPCLVAVPLGQHSVAAKMKSVCESPQ